METNTKSAYDEYTLNYEYTFLQNTKLTDLITYWYNYQVNGSYNNAGDDEMVAF